MTNSNQLAMKSYVFPLFPVTDKPLDLIYVVDVSDRKNDNNYIETVQQFIQKDINLYLLSPTETRVAIVTFSDKPVMVINPLDGSHTQNVIGSLPSK